MNEIQFIKDHGVEKSREVVSGAPEKSVYYRDMDSVFSPNEVLYYAWFGGVLLVKDEKKGWTRSIYHTGEEYILDQLGRVDELKRLVEIVDLINTHGGHKKVKLVNLEAENEELRKRIDAGLEIADKMGRASNSVALFSYDLYKALKGGAHDKN